MINNRIKEEKDALPAPGSENEETVEAKFDQLMTFYSHWTVTMLSSLAIVTNKN